MAVLHAPVQYALSTCILISPAHYCCSALQCLLLCACITLCVTLAGALCSYIVCLCFLSYEGRVWSCSTCQTPCSMTPWSGSC